MKQKKSIKKNSRKVTIQNLEKKRESLDVYKRQIDKNLLAQNSKLPATREMAKLLGVSRNSVITAYENLEAEGVLYTIKGKGTFISSRNIDLSVKWNVSWEDYISDYGVKASELDIVKNEIPRCV